MPVVDTLKLKTRLANSGMPEPQAQVLVEELDEALTAAVTGHLATKSDIADVRGEIAEVRGEVAELRGEVGELRGEIAEVRAVTNALAERFDQVDKRFEQVDKRFEQVDGRFEQVDRRLDQMNGMMFRLYALVVFGFIGTIAVILLKDLVFK